MVDSIKEGAVADFSGDGPPQERGRHPRVRGPLIRELCLGKDPSTPRGMHGKDTVHIKGLTITGQIDLVDADIPCRILLTDCIFECGLDLRNAHAKQSIRLTGCRLPSFAADRMFSPGDLELCAVTVQGEATFVETHLHGDLRCTGSTFENPKGSAIDCTGMTIKDSVHFDGLKATGVVSLTSAHISGNLDFRRSTLHNPQGQCLDGTHLTVDGDLIWENDFKAHGEVCLRWARLKALRGSGASLTAQSTPALQAEGIHVTENIILDEGFTARGEVQMVAARVENKIRFSNATLERSGGRALHAERIEAGEVYLNETQISGEVCLVGAEIQSQLNCTGGTFNRDGGKYALNAALLVCRGEVYLDDGFTAAGEVRLTGAEAKRELNCTGGTFENEAGCALNADGMTTQGSVFLDKRFSAVGEVRFARATVGRQLDCAGGTFKNIGGMALDVSGMVCEGDVKLSEGFSAAGTVKLEGTRITRDLDCQRGTFYAANGTAFLGTELQVGGSFLWKSVELDAGTVDLSFASVRIFKDDRESWPTNDGRKHELTGFTYESLVSEMTADNRETWLENTPTYSAQPYQQLALVHLQGGQTDRAMHITMANHRDRRKRGEWGKARRGKKLTPGIWAAKSWDVFIGWTVRYGYQFHRPLLTLLVIGLTNIVLFYIANNTGVMHPTSRSLAEGKALSDKCDGNYPCFVPPVYAFEILTPVLNLRQINYWLPTPTDPWGKFLFAWVVFNIALGWLASIAIAGGLTYYFSGDRRARS
ncbi:hypothetical protein [Streptomyces cinnamoneus]|uniref:hypothetical protein n=1 Tax=Streptomyces cinnamoneus TaxID=53446 RepID=UPI00167DE824|nr:hypothetical protein [Streptomyces cinnamoneus]